MEQQIVALPKPRRRANQRQRLHLVETLQANLDIARAIKLGNTDDAEVLAFWLKLTDELNLMGKKWTVLDWQYTWAIWCKKLRGKCRRIAASLQAKDGPLNTTKERLNEIEVKILDVISRTENDGHIDSSSLNQSQTGKRKENQILQSTSSPSESGDFVSFSYQIENKQEEMASSAKSRKRTSMKTSTPSQGLKVECRVCLQYVCCGSQCCEIFGPWNQNPETTIASYFTQVTNIQVSPTDMYTKYICFKCLGLLQNCVLFIERAHNTETLLQKRYEMPINDSSESLWPKPIQVNKCLSNDNKIEIEVKQEVLSDEEVPVMEMDNEELRMDIKVEPEEYASYDCSPQIMDTVSITPMLDDESMDNSDVNTYEDEHVNHTTIREEEAIRMVDNRSEYLEEHVKEEPPSDYESDRATPDLPLDCMLCTKTFNFVSGLRAHVIAQHSYLTIARKPEVRPPIHQCFTCRRTFTTHTDLIVHESCHGKYACYMCNSKFETFVSLTKHRKRCRNNGNHVSRLKTLDDVKRPSPDPQHTKVADSIYTVLEPQIISKETVNWTEVTKRVEEQIIDDAKTVNPRDMESKAADSTNTDSQSQKIQHAKLGDSINNFKTMSQKIEDLTNTESQSQTDKPITVSYVLDDRQSGAIIETISDDSPQNSNNSITEEENNANSKEKNANSEVNNANSEVNNANSKVDNHYSENNFNTELNSSNSVVNNSKSEVNNVNCESTNPNQTPMDVAHIELDNKVEDFDKPAPETNIKKTLSNNISQKQSLNSEKANSNSPKPSLLSGTTEEASRNVTVVNSDHISDNGNSVSKDSNLESDNRESVLEVNNTKESLTECAKSIEISEDSKEKTPSLVTETDSMEIHLAIHSLEKKSTDKLNEMQIDEEMIETKGSNEDKVLQ